MQKYTLVDMDVNISKFAEMAKVSRQTISKQCIKGNLAKKPNGLIDTTHIINAEYLRKKALEKAQSSQPASQPSHDEQFQEAVVKSVTKKSNKKTTTKKTNTSKKKPGVNQKANNKDESLQEPVSDLTGPLSGYAKYDLERLKIIETIEKTRLENSIKRKTLVDVNISRLVYSKIYEIHMNEFLTVKDKLVPDLASIFGISDQAKIFDAGDKIDKMLWKVLDHVKLEINKFLIKVKVDELE